MYGAVFPEAVISVIMHKLLHVLVKKNVTEARILLRDWLVLFVTDFHRNRHVGKDALGAPIDLTFDPHTSLGMLTQLVYALLSSPLLSHLGEAS